MKRKKVLIVDIDGTVSDSIGRVNHISTKYGKDSDNWTIEQINEFLDLCHKDKIVDGASNLKKIIKRLNAEIVFLTGRSERGREVSYNWIVKNLNIKPKLFMRKNEDFRASFESKLEIFENNILPFFPDNEFIFLDDDIKCLNAFNKYGVTLHSPYCWKALFYMNKM